MPQAYVSRLPRKFVALAKVERRDATGQAIYIVVTEKFSPYFMTTRPNSESAALCLNLAQIDR